MIGADSAALHPAGCSLLRTPIAMQPTAHAHGHFHSKLLSSQEISLGHPGIPSVI